MVPWVLLTLLILLDLCLVCVLVSVKRNYAQFLCVDLPNVLVVCGYEADVELCYATRCQRWSAYGWVGPQEKHFSRRGSVGFLNVD